MSLPLCERNVAEIRDGRWNYDARKLMDAIRAALDTSRRSEG